MEKMKKIVVSGGKGGVGKSMLASALAMLFSKTQKVVAVDCDVDAPNLAIWLGGVAKWDKTIPVIASARPIIDLNKCNSCGLCVKNCRFNALALKNSKPKLNQFLCEGCGACENLDHYNFTRRNRNALVITETELKLIAAAAIIGLKSRPKAGYRMPAAIGTPRPL